MLAYICHPSNGNLVIACIISSFFILETAFSQVMFIFAVVSVSILVASVIAVT